MKTIGLLGIIAAMFIGGWGIVEKRDVLAGGGIILFAVSFLVFVIGRSRDRA